MNTGLRFLLQICGGLLIYATFIIWYPIVMAWAIITAIIGVFKDEDGPPELHEYVPGDGYWPPDATPSYCVMANENDDEDEDLDDGDDWDGDDDDWDDDDDDDDDGHSSCPD